MAENDTIAPAAPLLLSISDVARELGGVNKRQIYRLLASGRLYGPDVTLGPSGRLKRWRRDRLEAWIRANCPPGIVPLPPAR